MLLKNLNHQQDLQFRGKNKTIIEMLINERWLIITIKGFVGIFGGNSIIMSNKIYIYSFFCYG